MAAVVCHRVWTSARSWAQDARTGDGAFLAGALESLLATAVGVVLMPVLLWAGMRLLRERGNHLLVAVGAVVWPVLGGHVVENAVGAGATVAYLALFAAVGALPARVEVRRR
ncbi:hypothetical protein F0L17_21530 [Streptomyces sp. TRM43335]|uniref:Uncharacterized protein n=1 Tax=Streptomyces taklimakanensis TaxID=2569853 RepID=A0A6G2BH87_9ACTN|nr:hypothetical protein [Streptomyces taklimakanensis]